MAYKDDCLKMGEQLEEGQWLRSKNELFYAVLQEDGNFVIYRGDWETAEKQYNLDTQLWSTVKNDNKNVNYAIDKHTGKPFPGRHYLVMQGDSNLVIYATPEGKKAHPIWALNTNHSEKLLEKGNWAVLSNDGKFTVKGPSGTIKMSSELTDSIIPSSEKWEHIEYFTKKNDVTIKPVGGPHEALSEVAVNHTKVPQNIDLSMSFLQSTTSTFKSVSTLKIGASTSITAGLPGLADGKVSVSTDFSQSIEWGKSHTESKTINYKLPAEVPPEAQVVGRMTWSVSRLTVPFSMHGTCKFHGLKGRLIPISVSGVYEGVVSHDAHAEWSEVPSDTPKARNWKGSTAVSLPAK